MFTLAIIVSIVFLVLVVLAIGTTVFTALAEWRNPPVGKFVDAQGLRLHYIERGNPADPVVVVLHGNGSMIQDMTISGLIELLCRRNRVICFDRPGFGHSTRTRVKLWTTRGTGRPIRRGSHDARRPPSRYPRPLLGDLGCGGFCSPR